MTFLNITIGEKEFDEIKEGKVGLVCLPCTPRWCHTLVDGVKREERLDQLTARLDSNGNLIFSMGTLSNITLRKLIMFSFPVRLVLK